MPDWYVHKNEEGSAFLYQIRLGGCEYSLTEEEFKEFAMAVYSVRCGTIAYAESEDYKDLVIASEAQSEQRLSLSKMLGLAKEPLRRRF